MRYAIILNSTHRKHEFRPDKGFFLKECQDLTKAGYTVLSFDVDDPDDLASYAEKLSMSSVGLLWIRMHGGPTSMRASDAFCYTSDNISHYFSWLPKRLTNDAVIYLDSCLTGSLEDDFYNNMQFSFARLTQKQKQVLIYAPYNSEHRQMLRIKADGRISIFMNERPNSVTNITVRLGKKTKQLLDDNVTDEKRLKASLHISKREVNLHAQFTYVSQTILEKNEYTLVNVLSSIINEYDNFQNMIAEYKLNKNTSKFNVFCRLDRFFSELVEVIERFYISPNLAAESQYSQCVGPVYKETPLAFAVYVKHDQMIAYLLAKGADPFYQLVRRNQSIFDYAVENDSNPGGKRVKSLFIDDQKQRFLRRQDNKLPVNQAVVATQSRFFASNDATSCVDEKNKKPTRRQRSHSI